MIRAALEIIAILLELTRMLERCIGHSLNTITIGVDDKCGVVVLPVLGTQSGRPVVLPTMLQSRGVETRHGLARWGGECDMETRTRCDDLPRTEFDGQLVIAARPPITDGCRVAPDSHIAQRREHCIVEGGGTLKIGDAEREVMQHAGFRRQICVARASHIHAVSLTAYTRFACRKSVTPAGLRWSAQQWSVDLDRWPSPRPPAQVTSLLRCDELQHRQSSRRAPPYRRFRC